jgi:FkbM family methyltransferase
VLGTLNRYASRQVAARRLGIHTLSFGRLAHHPPSRVRMGTGWLSLELEAGPSVVRPLVSVLIDDCYGLRRVKGLHRILDVGGDVGIFGVAARIAHPNALIHCYEPSPRVRRVLDHQGAAAGVVVYHEAVGGEDGQVAVEEFAGAVAGRPGDRSADTVRQVAFDEAVSRMGGRVDLVKLDCGGAEWSFFSSAAWGRVDRVAMEYHLSADPPHTHDELRATVRALGFRETHWEPQETSGLIRAER